MSKEKTPAEIWVEKNASRVLGKPLNKMMTTQLLTIIDDYDEVVIREILGIFNHKNCQIILDAFNNGSFMKAHKHVINMAFALVSINVHRRNYFQKFEDAKVRATKEMESWESKSETQIYDQSLGVEVQGALINFKAALDSLAQALAAVYGLGGIKRWGKNGDDVLKSLKNNLKKEYVTHTQRLIEFIESHQKDTKDFIALRDNLGHGLAKYDEVVSGFFKRKIDTEVQNPRAQLGTSVVDCSHLLDKCSEIAINYCREAIAITLSSIIPNIEIGNDNGKYRWTHEIVAIQDVNSGDIDLV